jgi:hypothetical protein
MLRNPSAEGGTSSFELIAMGLCVKTPDGMDVSVDNQQEKFIQFQEVLTHGRPGNQNP